MLDNAASGAIAREHSPSFHHGAKANTALTPFETAMFVLGLHGKRRQLMTMLGHRITRGAVIHWRKGRHSPPAWAIETMLAALDSKRAELDHAAALLAAQLEKRNATPR